MADYRYLMSDSLCHLYDVDLTTNHIPEHTDTSQTITMQVDFIHRTSFSSYHSRLTCTFVCVVLQYDRGAMMPRGQRSAAVVSEPCWSGRSSAMSDGATVSGYSQDFPLPSQVSLVFIHRIMKLAKSCHSLDVSFRIFPKVQHTAT